MSAVPDFGLSDSGADVLRALAARAMAAMDADGLAIALDRGDGMVCEASSGEAPAVGAKVGPGSTLSDQCIREATLVAFSRDAGESGDAYSTVLAPIIWESRAIGLCVAFANRANAFADAHMAALAATATAVCRYGLKRSSPAGAEVRDDPTDMPAPGLVDADLLKGIEDQITEFAALERRRSRKAMAVKCAVVALLLCGLGASFVPDRVNAWLAPIIQRLQRPPQHDPSRSPGSDRASR